MEVNEAILDANYYVLKELYFNACQSSHRLFLLKSISLSLSILYFNKHCWHKKEMEKENRRTYSENLQWEPNSQHLNSVENSFHQHVIPWTERRGTFIQSNKRG